ncbi:MAG: type II toxin-antitoxin system YafQ family toxin [Leptolyngbyaceae cyanobacterium]
MKIVWDNRFKRRFKKLTKANPVLQNKVIGVLRLLANDPFTPSLKTHKLTGTLDGLWSCSVAYDCRIIFSLATNKNQDQQEIFILLLDIGSHDEVY